MLDKLEEFLEGKNEREKIIIILMPVMLFGAISYLYLFPLAENYLKNVQNQNSSLIVRIDKNINYLQSIRADLGENAIIAKYKEIVYKIKSEVEKINSKTNYINSKIDKFTREQNRWSSFLDFIAFASNRNNLDISNITSIQFPYSNQRLFKNLHIEVQGSGEFKDILNYINDIETFGVFVDLDNLVLHYNEDKKKLIFNLNIYNWEIKT